MKALFIKVILCFAIPRSHSVQKQNRDKSVDDDDGKSSLVFVFDTTASMSNDLRQLREGAEMIMKTALEESNIIADFVFVPFHDPTIGPATFTRDKEVFKAALRIKNVRGGGDCPEKSLGGIHLALTISRPRSFLYVFTDATASDHKLVRKVLDAVQRKQSQVVFVLTGHCNDVDQPSYKVYQQIATASSGQVFNLNKTNVHEVLDFVRSSIKRRNVNLVSAVHPGGYNHTQEIPVDSSVDEVTVSVSGAKPKIKVVNPSGEELLGPPKLIKTLDLSEIMIVKVMEPEPGNWTITVGSEKDYSVKVSGLSNLTFSHGFSVKRPKSMVETSYRPLQGAYNHMLLSLTQADRPINIEFVELLTTDGKTLFEVPVKGLEGGNTFLTEAFVPPDDFFYIAINGHDQNGQELRRIGATAVQAKPPDVPYLSAPKKIQAHLHQRVVLKCFVESLVPVTVKWSTDLSRIQRQTSSLQSTSLEYVIEDMTEREMGTYRCSANNVAGRSTTSTKVALIVDPPQVFILPANGTFPLGADLTIVCSVFSETLLLGGQIIFNDTVNVTNFQISPITDGLYTFNKTFSNVSGKDRGLYTCVAANKELTYSAGGASNQSSYIDVEKEPTAQIIGPHSVNKHLYDDMQLVCQVEGASTVRWVAPNGTVVKEQAVSSSFSSVLDVHNVTDEGSWSCIAIKNSHKASDAVDLKVLMKPIVKIAGEKNLTVVIGDIHQLECTVRAKPPPRIVWHKETDAFLNCTLDEIEPSVYKSVLTLNSSAEHVNGTYFCFGENSAGISQDSVTVNERTRMVLVESFTDQLVQLYSTVELRCAAQSQPAAVATFFHNGTQLPTNMTRPLPGGSVLRLSGVHFTDLGRYECHLDNGYERLQVVGTLQVTGLEIPVLSKEPTTVSVQRGDAAIITCRVLKGNPEPKIKWLYGNDRNDLGDIRRDIEILIKDGGREIKLQNVTIGHAGLYRCAAENDVGRDTYEVSLVVQYPPNLIVPSDLIETSNLEVEAGEKIILNCNAVGNPQPIVVWTKESLPISFSDRIYLNITSHLVIANATVEDSGVYNCNVTNPLGSVGRDYTIQVFMKPSITALENATKVEVLVGQPVELVCPVQGAPTPQISWSHNGQGPNLAAQVHGDILRFVANLTDVGEYTCNASNQYGSAVFNYSVFVWDPPHLLTGSQLNETNEFNVEVGKKIVLSCNAFGKPPPIVIWTKESRPIPPSANVHLGVNELVVDNATVLDSGLYGCNATSPFGSVGKNYTLRVFMKPLITVPKSGTEVGVLEGQVLELTCPVQGSPAPVLSWSHNGRPPKETAHAHDYTLRFVANLTDIGEYSCNASNEYGSTVLNYTVNVWDPPHLIEASGSNKENQLEVEVGKQVTLSCDAVGNPPPIVVWTKESRPVPYSENVYLTDTNDLVLSNATVYNDGVYSCNATSPFGSVVRNYTVRTFMKPSITTSTDSTEVEVLEGQLVELTCPVLGVPTPSLSWSHNGQALKPTAHAYGQTLRFVANLTDFGDYSCNASNEYGSAVLNFTVYVWVAPYLRPPLLESISVRAGSNISLRCDAVGFPLPFIVWQFGSKRLLENTTRVSFNEIGNLYITNASSEDEGQYVCLAENVAGVASKAILLQVHEPPTIVQDNYTGPYVATVLDTTLVIACEVTGKPRPYVLWSKDDYYLDKDSRYEFGMDGSLIIKSPSEELSGDYTCIATNPAGNASRTVSVQIYSVPTLVQSEGSQTVVTVVEGTNATVECPVRVASNDTIKWYKEAVLVSEGKLELKPVRRSDASQYACVGRNVAGSRHATVNVQVHWPPALVRPDIDDIDDTDVLDVFSASPAMDSTSMSNPFLSNLSDLTLNPLLVDPPLATHAISTSDKAQSNLTPLEPDQTNHVRLLRGDDLRLDCTVDAKPRAKTKWYFNSKLLLGEDRGVLKILDVQLRHTGVYKCVATNQYGTDFKEFVVEVLVPPFISEFDVLDVQLKMGTNASLECNAQGSPKPEINWSFNNTSWRVHNATIVSVNVSAESEGVYRCDARNAAGVTRLVYRVSAVGGAVIKTITAFNGSVGTTIIDRLEIALGTQIRIACSVSGRPIPKVQWFRHGEAVSDNIANTTYADLLINKAESSDAGQYSCVASNEGGVDEKKIRIDVIEPPRIFRKLFEDDESASGNTINLEVMSGQAFYMHCHPFGNPIPEIYWFKDDIPLRLFDGTMISTDYGEIIQSPSAKFEQSGNYTCIAKNKIGETGLVYLVDVLVPPTQPKESAQDVSTSMGKKLNLTCPVQGVPPPYVMWMKHPYNEISEDTPRVRLTENNVSLIIDDTVIEDSGIYSCVMTNKVGTSEVTFNVVIEKAPIIIGNIGNHSMEEHIISLRRSIVLKCDVEGHPPPKIRWLKDIQVLREGRAHVQRILGGSVLGVWGAEARDAGQYICVAENAAGAASRRYNVRVKVPGKWSAWSQWSYCNVTCGLGYQNRSRICHFIDNDNNGIDSTANSDKLILDESSCKGSSFDRRKCHMPSCEEEEGWSGWSRWSTCSATCGTGTQLRRRRCRARGLCPGDNVQIRKCPDLPTCSRLRKTSYETNSSQESKETDMYTPEETIEMLPEDYNNRRSSDFGEFYNPTDKKARVYFDVNVTENLDRSPQGPCRPGFRHNSVDDSCEDVDECSMESNSCHATQVCTNMAGKYRCSCPRGFLSLGVGQRCLDVNECEQEIHGCEYACVNVAGGYVCACPRHLRLHVDRHHCVPPSQYQRPLPYYEDSEYEDYLSAPFNLPKKHIKYPRYS